MPQAAEGRFASKWAPSVLSGSELPVEANMMLAIPDCSQDDSHGFSLVEADLVRQGFVPVSSAQESTAVQASDTWVSNCRATLLLAATASTSAARSAAQWSNNRAVLGPAA